MKAHPHKGDALLVVDMQVDFVVGSLAVPGSREIVPVVDGYLREFARRRLPVVLSRDWHPPDHVSFRPQGGPWPPHCVADTPGAAFEPALSIPAGALVVSKATTARAEAYSAFEGTDLAARLRAHGVRRLFVCGLATDYCVKATVHDALRAGFRVVLLVDAIRAVDAKRGDGARAERAMRAAGAILATFEEVAGAAAAHG